MDAAGDPTSKSKPLAHMAVPNCRHTRFEDTLNVHFTLCQKPWSCQRGHRQALCMDFHREWMARRAALEAKLHRGRGDGKKAPPPACKKGRSGEGAYTPLDIPLDRPLLLLLSSSGSSSGQQ